jgi:hypothetical protein
MFPARSRRATPGPLSPTNSHKQHHDSRLRARNFYPSNAPDKTSETLAMQTFSRLHRSVQHAAWAALAPAFNKLKKN